MIPTTTLDLFVGISVSDLASALQWYEQLLGFPPTFFPNDIEAVWELAQHRYLYIEQRPDHAGHALLTLFVANLDSLTTAIAGRGLQPTQRETYDNGVRKITYYDRDGNEISFGGAPV